MKKYLLITLTSVILFLMSFTSFSQTPDLGTASNFTLFTAVGAFDNIGAGTTATGDVGTNVGAFTAFPPGTLFGEIHVADAVSAQAALDVNAAYAYLSTLPCGAVLGTTMGSGQVLTPNTYCLGAASTLNGELILDGQGNPDAIFIFQIDGAFTTGTFSTVTLINSASLCNVYWQVNGQFSLGDNSIFRGTLVNSGAINLLEGATLLGRALSTSGAISLHNNIVTISSEPVAAIITAGGPTEFCEGGSVILSGNIDGIWNTGATTSSITVTTAGDYFVTNTNECGTVTSNHIIVTINTPPVAAIITPLGPTEFCAGGSLTIIGNVSGVWSTGETSASITVTTAGDYFVTNTNACGTVTSNHIIVTINPLPVAAIISADGPTEFCEGGSVILSGNIDGTWSTGETTSSITVTTAGDYFVTNTNACGTVTSNHIIITISPAPIASVITASGATEFCLGGEVILSGNVDGTWSTGETTSSITVTTAGDYFVTNTNACGTVTSNHIIVTINPSPVAAIISADGPTEFCEGGSVILSGNIDGTWSTGATTSSITVTTAGDYFVTNTNACGTVTSNHIIITISPAPVASVITASGATEFCLGGSVILSGNVGGTWSTGETTSSITVTTAGDYFVTNTNACGTVTSNHINVTISASPVAAVIIAEGAISFCPGASVILSGNIDGTWNTGETTPTIIASAAGDYFVTNTNACGTVTSNHILITIYPVPFCNITGDATICEGETTHLCAPIDCTDFLWNTGDTTGCIEVTTSGTYTVTITNGGGCVSTCSKTVIVTPLPIASIITSEGETTFCDGNYVILSGNVGGVWNTGATTSSITVTTAGDYFVINSNECGSVASNHIIVTVNSLPVCNIQGDGKICEGDTTLLCAPEGYVSYLWSTGATTNCIEVYTAGTYSVTVTNENGCTSTCSKKIHIYEEPIASVIMADGPVTFCEGNNVILTGNVGGVWNTGATTASITVNASGDYYVTNSTGCASVISNHIIVVVNPLPICKIQGEGKICEGDTTLLCAPEGYVSYLWSTGATTNCIEVYTAGTYSVTVTNENGCTSTCSKKIHIYEEPIASVIEAEGPVTFCEGNNVILTGNVGGVWNTGATTASIIVNASGNYYVTNSTGCASVVSNHIIVVVNPLPNCKIKGEGKICEGDTTHLCAAAGYASYLWSTGETTGCIEVTIAGTYSVTVTNEFGCSSTCSKTVHSYPVPVASVISADGATSFCAGGSVTLSGNIDGVWNTGSTSSEILVTTSGDYYVTNTTGCGSIISNHIIVTVSPIPTCNITGDAIICVGETSHLCAPAGYASYLWSTGATTGCISVTTAGTYSVTITNAAGCSSTCSKIVTVFSAPVESIITASGATTFCEGGSVTLSGNVGGVWNTGATTSSIIVTASGDYYVTNTTGCGSVVSNHIVVTENEIPICEITGDTCICVGETTHICAPAGYASYLWSNGATTPCIFVSEVGNYSVIVTNEAGCSSSCDVDVTAGPWKLGETKRKLSESNIIVKAYPNPFEYNSIIEFKNTESDSHIIVEFYGVTDNKISILFDGDIEKGVWYQAVVNGENIPSGVYIYRIVNGEQIITGKLVLSK